MTTESENIKNLVREKYDQIARNSNEEQTSSCCCGSSCCSGGGEDYSVFNDDYTHVQGYQEEADLGLGCGIPTEYANLQKGETVLDLGSGAGNDCFVAYSLVGEEGFVYGIDFSAEMVAKARQNAEKLGIRNIGFAHGDIENMPFKDGIMDKVLSNCVLNLVPDKAKAFQEIYRVLKTGGSFCISDVVTYGKLPDALLKDAEMYAGCVSGALEMDDYLERIREAGFSDIEICTEKKIELPEDILLKYVSKSELNDFRSLGNGIYSITVSAKK